MSLAKGPDPIKPMITFDNYIIPESVKEVRKPAKRVVSASPVGAYFSSSPKQADAPRKTPTGLIVLGTFLLGVVSALYFARPSQTVRVAEMPLMDAAVAETATAVTYGSEMPVVEALQAAEAEATESLGAEPVVELVLMEPELSSPAALQRVVTASLQQSVTRQEPADLITPTGANSTLDSSELSLAEILLGLTPKRTTTELTDTEIEAKSSNGFLNRDILETLRESVLSGTYSVKTVKRNGVKRLCLRVPDADVSQDQAADLLRDAAARGEIELPDALSTSDGDFDADTLIFNLVQTSLANDGTDAGAQAAKEMSRRAFVASNAKTDKVDGARVYIVQPGDSLAYLSLQFYGRPSAYPRIYQANRGILRSPDYIQVGQRLIIPG